MSSDAAQALRLKEAEALVKELHAENLAQKNEVGLNLLAVLTDIEIFRYQTRWVYANPGCTALSKHSDIQTDVILNFSFWR